VRTVDCFATVGLLCKVCDSSSDESFLPMQFDVFGFMKDAPRNFYFVCVCEIDRLCGLVVRLPGC
jgi:hypothetical protein